MPTDHPPDDTRLSGPDSAADAPAADAPIAGRPALRLAPGRGEAPAEAALIRPRRARPVLVLHRPPVPDGAPDRAPDGAPDGRAPPPCPVPATRDEPGGALAGLVVAVPLSAALWTGFYFGLRWLLS